MLHYSSPALIEDFAVGKSNNSVAQFVEVRDAGLIVFDLLGVGIAIDFDAQFGFMPLSRPVVLAGPPTTAAGSVTATV